MLLGDSLILIEMGILAIVLSSELSAKRSRFMARGFAYAYLLIATQPRKLAYPPPSLFAKILKPQFKFNPAFDGDRVLPIFEGIIGSHAVLDKVPP